MFSFKCGACDDVFKAVRPCAWCPRCGWLNAAADPPEKPESAPVLFRFVLGHCSREFAQAALSNSSGAFPATLDHLFAAGYALVEGQDRRDQLLAHLCRLPGYTPDAIEVRP